MRFPHQLVCASLLCGCGSSEAGAPRPSDTGTADTNVLDSATDADVAAPLTKQTLLVNSGIFWTDATTVGNTNLWFLNAGAPPCTVEKKGECYTVKCTSAPSPIYVSAGTLTLSVGLRTALTATHDSTGVYPFTTKTGVASWKQGDGLLFAGSGGDVPAFSKTMVAPGQLEPIAPALVAGVVPLDRTKDFSMSWKPIASTVTITASQLPPSAKSVVVGQRFLCEVEGSKGTFTIPSSVLSVLEATGADFPATNLNIGASASADLDVGGYALHFHAIQAQMYPAEVK